MNKEIEIMIADLTASIPAFNSLTPNSEAAKSIGRYIELIEKLVRENEEMKLAIAAARRTLFDIPKP